MRRAASAAVVALAGLLLLLIAGPLLALVASTVGGALLRGLRHPLVVPALSLTLITTLIALAVVVLTGTALAWRLARAESRAARWVEQLIQLPVVVPPAVAGLALLLAFGRQGPFGEVLAEHGLSIAFTPVAVVLAEIFVSSPFYVQAALAAFRRVDPDVVLMARSLGASRSRVFFEVVLPTTLPALASGAAVSWARAVGEFGATLMFAGNLSGVTQTLPLAIYSALEADLDAARALSVLLIATSAVLLGLLRYASGRAGRLRLPGATG